MKKYCAHCGAIKKNAFVSHTDYPVEMMGFLVGILKATKRNLEMNKPDWAMKAIDDGLSAYEAFKDTQSKEQIPGDD